MNERESLREARVDPRDWGYEDYHAVFFSWEKAVPVYHGFDFHRREPDTSISADMTRCGLLIASYDHETKRLKEPGTWIPLRHAVKFGKPCGKCFKVAEAE